MDLFKPNSLKGEWFRWGDDSEILVRMIPADVDEKFHRQRWKGRTNEDIEKEGGATLGMVVLNDYLLDRGCYALLDSRNIWAPAEMVPALQKLEAAAQAEGNRTPEHRDDGMIRLDGFWTEEVKRQVLNEVMEAGALGFHILDCSKALMAMVEKKKERLGKA